ncbi:hypothetical protein VIBC2010_19675 [Vibrio caribbeanicus ATCC BAA-2122]|uniref:Uncharacterized protein n=1 Tax=Vibrio caribbeanicus ATCC BAA-2122 TaxID=796620 RepID=E3BP98_9VIBR|nr:hypothetical protein VIBC2010_19675 [Vibrio caribbeanicus ATCC BAA-2122]
MVCVSLTFKVVQPIIESKLKMLYLSQRLNLINENIDIYRTFNLVMLHFVDIMSSYA